MSNQTFQDVRKKLTEFINERNWNQFHTPKNLAMALSVEVGELVELLMWRQDNNILHEMENNHELEKAVREEMADIFNYLIHLSMLFEIDLVQASIEKIEENKKKYTLEKAKEFEDKHNFSLN